ncbi:MAG: hypothetical protein ACPGSW_00195 [Phaeobacter italicus]
MIHAAPALPARPVWALAGLALSALSWQVTPVQAQEGGLRAQFSLSEQLRSTTDDGEKARTELGFDFSSVTRSQSLDFSLSGALDKDLNDDLHSTLENPRAALAYRLSNRNSALRFSTNYRRSDAQSLTALDPLDTTDLTLLDGDREVLRSSLALEFGRAGPFGADLTLSMGETNFSGPVAGTLLDSTSAQASLNFRFDIDPRITARARFEISDLDRDGGRDDRTERVSVGATFAINKVLTGNIDLGRTEARQTLAGVTTSQSGLFYELGLGLQRPNGTLSGNLRSDIDQNGRRTSLRVDRALELPNGALEFGAGVSQDADTDGVDPLYSLSYTRTGPRSTFNAGFEQIFGTNSAGDETLNSRLQLSLSNQLSETATLNSRLALRDTKNGGSDTQQLDLSFDYAQELTNDWSFIAGYSHTRQTRNSGTDDTDDRLFVGVRLTRDWRP